VTVGVFFVAKGTQVDEPLELVRRALRGDTKSVRALVQRLTPVFQARAVRALLRSGRGLLPRDVRQEVEDMVQTLFIIFFANDGKLFFDWDPARGKTFDGYVALVADCRLASVLRTRRGRVWPDDPTEVEVLENSTEIQLGPEPVVHSREELELIMRRFKEVATERGHELFVLLYVEERSAEEVSAITGLSVENVHQHKSRLGKLARRIAHDVLSYPNSAPHSAVRPQRKAGRT
jgi:RNA polymerase sigma factor (sigma-70 family)